jgi:hypothetical protein
MATEASCIRETVAVATYQRCRPRSHDFQRRDDDADVGRLTIGL